MTVTVAAGIAFRIDRMSSTPVFAQVYGAIRERIVAGDLAEGDRLPPSRSLAVELGLSRSTVNAAYDQLTAEGYVAGRQGAGYFVCPMGAVELAGPIRPPAPARPAPPATPDPPKVFQPGVPDMRLFPYRQWARHVSRAARTTPAALVSSGDPFGDPALRQAISSHIAEWRGVAAPPERIVVTAGSGDALEICIRALAAGGGRVGLEDPGYNLLRNFVESLGLTPVWLGVDAGGAELPSGDPPPDLVVLTPSHQFPLGGAMSPARRSAYLQWAERTGAWIIEDDYDSEFRYSGRPIPAMTGLDGGARTIYVGSFSKVFSNSLRLGYLVVPEAIMDAVGRTLRGFGVKASIAAQRPLATFMADGEFYRHIRRVRRIYNDRRKALIDALTQLDDLLAYEDHQAGMLVTARLDPAFDDRAVVRAAAAAGLGPLALSAFQARPLGANGLVLGFCAFTAAEIEAGTDVLAAILRDEGSSDVKVSATGRSA